MPPPLRAFFRRHSGGLPAGGFPAAWKARQWTFRSGPSAPVATKSRATRHDSVAWKRQEQHPITWCRPAASSRFTAAAFIATGFSSRMCFPAASAASGISVRSAAATANTTASISGSAVSSWALR
jgi:hypothetical protein